MDKWERYENVAYPYIFRKAVAAGDSGVAEMELTSHGFVTQVTVIIPAGDGGKLQIRPYATLPGEINQELLRYAEDEYISGDDVVYKLPCYQEIENHTMLKVAYNNTEVDPLADDAQLMVDIVVQYDAIVQPRNVIG